MTSKIKIIAGLSLLIIGEVLLMMWISNWKARQAIHSSFEKEPVEIQGFLKAEVDEVSLPKQIIISSLGIDLAVKPAKVVSGYWEVFIDSAGWGEGSGVPGHPGNQVIFAHARKGLFLPLRQARVGMKIEVITDDSQYTYEIIEIKEISPSQIEVIAPTTDETLTLYTCSGFTDSKRLIVVAKRI